MQVSTSLKTIYAIAETCLGKQRLPNSLPESHSNALLYISEVLVEGFGSSKGLEHGLDVLKRHIEKLETQALEVDFSLFDLDAIAKEHTLTLARRGFDTSDKEALYATVQEVMSEESTAMALRALKQTFAMLKK